MSTEQGRPGVWWLVEVRGHHGATSGTLRMSDEEVARRGVRAWEEAGYEAHLTRMVAVPPEVDASLDALENALSLAADVHLHDPTGIRDEAWDALEYLRGVLVSGETEPREESFLNETLRCGCIHVTGLGVDHFTYRCPDHAPTDTEDADE